MVLLISAVDHLNNYIYMLNKLRQASRAIKYTIPLSLALEFIDLIIEPRRREVRMNE